MLFSGLDVARLALILIWAVAVCSVVANAFELPAPWRLGRYERPVMYGAFFLGGGAFWILAFTSSSVLGLAALIASLVAVPFAGMLIGRTLGQRQTPDQPAPDAAREDREQSPTEPPRAA
jgi:ABC-type nitrate/sulfonate/bicarbonate transport system permease component